MSKRFTIVVSLAFLAATLSAQNATESSDNYRSKFVSLVRKARVLKASESN